jgi:hypothetical protein
MADYMSFAYVMSVILFVHALPTLASVFVPGWAAWRVFGPNKWVARRTLVVWFGTGVFGYVVLFAYYSIYGTPPQASSIFNHSFHGAFFGAGYGGLGAVLYFRAHRDNPARRARPMEGTHVA